MGHSDCLSRYLVLMASAASLYLPRYSLPTVLGRPDGMRVLLGSADSDLSQFGAEPTGAIHCFYSS